MTKIITEYFNINIPNEKLYAISKKVVKGCHGLEEDAGELYCSLYHASQMYTDARTGICKKEKISTILKVYFNEGVVSREDFYNEAIANNIPVKQVTYLLSSGSEMSFHKYPLTWIVKKISDVEDPYKNQISLLTEVFFEPLLDLQFNYPKFFTDNEKNHIIGLVNLLKNNPESFTLLSSTFFTPLIEVIFRKLVNSNGQFSDEMKPLIQSEKDYKEWKPVKDQIKLFQMINFGLNKGWISAETKSTFEAIRQTRNDIAHAKFPVNDKKDFARFISHGAEIVGFLNLLIKTYSSK